MITVLRIKRFFDELDEKKLTQYLFILIGGLVLVLGGITYYTQHRIKTLKNEIKKVNVIREKARDLLSKNAVVNMQRDEVDAILAQDNQFKIKEFFVELVANLNLTAQSSKETELSNPQDLDNGYSETKLDASFSGISMQRLCELLLQLEKNRRIFLKEVVITKSSQSNAIDVSLVIATLQQKIST